MVAIEKVNIMQLWLNFRKQKEKPLQVNESLTRVLILDLQIKKPVQITNHSLGV